MSEKSGKENYNTYIETNRNNYINSYNINSDYNKNKFYLNKIDNEEDTVEDYVSNNNDKNLKKFINFLKESNSVKFEDYNTETSSSNNFITKNNNGSFYKTDFISDKENNDQIIYNSSDNENYKYLPNNEDSLINDNSLYKTSNQLNNNFLLNELKKKALEISNFENVYSKVHTFLPPQNNVTTALKYLKLLANIEYNRIIEEENQKIFKKKSKNIKSKVEINEKSSELKKISSFNDFSEDIFIYNNQTKQYKCPQNDCLKEFPNLSRCRRHYITHTDFKPFKCINPGCIRKFSRKDNMLQHLRVHCPHKKNRHV